MIYAHVSIHDVSPETLKDVENMLGTLTAEQKRSIMLLIIPGLDWQEDQIDQLRKWVDQGHVLAGHGWEHKVKKRKRLYHKAHGLLISRFVAEHLSLSREEILELMQRNYEWFAEHDLPSPTHYVPPAWALGKVTLDDLKGCPFHSIETLRGVMLPSEGRFCPVPLLGYEADTAFRAFFLKRFNALNRKRVFSQDLIRIALHPHDLTHRLADDLLEDCNRYVCQATFR